MSDMSDSLLPEGSAAENSAAENSAAENSAAENWAAENSAAGDSAAGDAPTRDAGAGNDDRCVSAQLPTTVGRTLAGKYVVRAPLGSGAMGAVYLCEHAMLPGTRFAVKLLRPELCQEPEQRARFLQEGRVLLGLQHPNLVGVRDLGETDDGEIYLCLDFCEGLSLTDLLARRGALQPEDAVHVADQLLAGLEVAHRAGVVHRDLKPDHVIVGVQDQQELSIKILDFGIAAFDERGGSSTSRDREFLIGTPRYMSPEQAWGNPIDARSDLYTVGLLLHEMLTGTAAVQGQSTEELLTRQRIAQVSRLRDQMPAHPWQRPLERLLRRVVTRDPSRRISSARAFRDQLAAIRNGVSPARRGRRWGSALVGMAAACFVVSGAIWLLRDGEAHADRQPRNPGVVSPAPVIDEVTQPATPRARGDYPFACPLCGYEAGERRMCPIDGIRLRPRGF